MPGDATLKLALSKRAASDIRAISDYTIAKWGIDQAALYVAGLRDFLQSMADRGEMGVAPLVLPGSVRRAKYRSHFIFFKQQGDRLWIVRVLHEQMDLARHLTGG